MPLSKYPVVTVKHVQSTPSERWVINHKGNGYPIVDVYIELDGNLQKIIPVSVAYIDEDTAEITFSEPRAGFATVTI